MNKLYIILIIIFSNLSIAAFSQSVVLRIDDYGIDNVYFYNEFKNIIASHSAKVSIAAVPIKTNGQKWSSYEDSLFKELSGASCVEICQHGYSHKSYSYGTEFYGRSSIQQEKDIKNGKQLLEEKSGKIISVFVPPFNSYDNNTLNVINKLGFNTISGDYRRLNVNSNYYNIKSVPFTITLMDFIKLNRDNKLKKNKIYIVLIHGYDFLENKNYYYNYTFDQYNIFNSPYFAHTSLEEFSTLLDQLVRNNIKFYHINEISNTDPKFNYDNIAKANKVYKLLPMPKALELTNNGYLRFDKDIILSYGNIIIEIFFYLIIIVLSFIITFIIYNIKLLNIFNSALAVPITFMIIFTIITKGWKDFSFGYRAYILLSIWLGFSLELIRKHIIHKCKQ